MTYQAVWLGENDGHMRFSSTGFPEIEIRYLNKLPIEIVKIGEAELAEKPSHQERATFAPTMERTSGKFVINDATHPQDFLNGVKGYYKLERPGAYVIQAKFPSNSGWRLYDQQQSDIYSSKLVIRVGANSGPSYSDILSAVRAAFRDKNPDIQLVQIVDAKPKFTGYWVIARGYIDPYEQMDTLEDELFGLFVVDSQFQKIEKVVDVIPTFRWLDYKMWISDYDNSNVTIEGHGATYKDQKHVREYKDL